MNMDDAIDTIVDNNNDEDMLHTTDQDSTKEVMVNSADTTNEIPFVKVTYTFNNKDVMIKQFDSTTTSTIRIGLPEGVEPMKPQPGDFTYSGMHDSGPLPPPKEGGFMAQLVSYIQAAKNLNDQFMTTTIEQNEQQQLQQHHQQQQQQEQQNDQSVRIQHNEHDHSIILNSSTGSKINEEESEIDNSILPELKKAKMT